MMEPATLIAAWALACAGFYLFARATCALVRNATIAFAASRLGQHQNGGLRNHTEAR